MSIYGRIIFYDTRDGVVFHDTKESNTPLDVEQYYKELEEKYGNRKYMDHIQLNPGQYKEEFDIGLHCTILFPDKEFFFSTKDTKHHLGSKNTFNDRFWPLFEDLYEMFDDEKRTVNVEKLEKFFEDYKNFNLKAISNICPTVWYTFHELNNLRKKVDKSKMRLFDNGAFPRMEQFAHEIREDGIIIPLHIGFREKIVRLFDGGHRMEALTYLDNIGQWDNRKMLCIVYDTINVNFLDDPVINFELDQPVIMHIPTKLLPKYSCLKLQNVKPYDEDITEVHISRYLDAVVLARMYPNEITRTLVRLKRYTGKSLSNPYIQSQEVFDKWRKGVE